jgi:propanol-preferring alcohol dehydrogenase
LVAARDAKRIGIYGFGAAAHIITQVACWQGREVFAFTKPGDVDGQCFARELGASWAGSSNETPPQKIDASILFAPVGTLIPQALKHTAKGGTVICAGIHMSTIPAFAYSLLWGERSVCSIANLTRRDGEEFFTIAPRAGVKTKVEIFPLEAANEAILCVRGGKARGAVVLVMDKPA